MTSSPIAVGRDVRLVVVGSDAVAVESVGAALTGAAADVIVVGGDRTSSSDPLADGAHRFVTVIVRPDESTWTAVDALGAPTIVVFDHEPDGPQLLAAVRHGVVGAVQSHSPETALIEAARRAADGDAAFDPHLVRRLFDAVHADAHAGMEQPRLTPRELDVLRAIEGGMSVKQTAKALGISPRTVDNVQRFMFRKLGVRNRVQAVARSHALGLSGDGGV